MGYVLDRLYSFDELIELALQKSKSEHNNFGAIEFIMTGTKKQKHFREEFISFVKQAILEEDCVKITDYFQYFLYGIAYDLQLKCLYMKGGNYYVGKLLRNYAEWRAIEKKVFDKLKSNGFYKKWYEDFQNAKEDVRGRLRKYPSISNSN